MKKEFDNAGVHYTFVRWEQYIPSEQYHEGPPIPRYAIFTDGNGVELSIHPYNPMLQTEKDLEIARAFEEPLGFKFKPVARRKK